MKVLVIGSGGREHALCRALAASASRVYCAPGNPGTARIATNLAIDTADHGAVIEAVGEVGIDLTVIGPEGPLAAGLADDLANAGQPVFGPSAAASRIEASKAFAKEIMARAGVPTAEAEVFADTEAAVAHIQQHPEPLVVKASGLAGGKGAIVCQTRDLAVKAVRELFGGRFGSAGDEVLVEEFMTGEELSVFVVADGQRYVMLPPAQDHKRLEEGDRGPNTGGMGAYSPVSIGTPELLSRVERDIIRPTLKELESAETPYKGILYVGLMISEHGAPRVVEFNCRFGDPEAQVVLPLLDWSIGELMWSIAAGESWQAPADADATGRHALTTVVAAEGYPESPRKGAPVAIPDELPEYEILYQAGTARDSDGRLVVAGGRVLSATGLGDSLEQARDRSLGLVSRIRFDGMTYRRDIGWRELERARAS